GETEVIRPWNSSGSDVVVTVWAAPSVTSPTLVSGTPNTALTWRVSASRKAGVPVPARAPISTLRERTHPVRGDCTEQSLRAVLACSRLAFALATDAEPASLAACAASYWALV